MLSSPDAEAKNTCLLHRGAHVAFMPAALLKVPDFVVRIQQNTRTSSNNFRATVSST
ncbi:hypothetical protein DPMN_106250 [Dreissena polymorpha]|uniref:Uncharacterized protein n=1 Tax=Dreissena polymorpha TaxID=45954 RepID=A0A9D4K4T9_DREPO|nr:hypothetical protein DPMN_106250 [Dreissena polymorpha]